MARRSNLPRPQRRRCAFASPFTLDPLEPRMLLSAALVLTDPQIIAGSANVRVSFDTTTRQSEMSVAINPSNPLNIVAFTHRINAGATMATYYTFDGGNTWTPKIIDNSVDGISGTFRFDPTLTFDEQGRLYISYGVDPSGGTRRLVVGRSLDGGQSYAGFSTVATASSLDKWIIGAGRDPVNPNQQNVYLAYRITQGGATSIRVAASHDGAVTWPVNTLVPDDAQAGSDFSSFGMPAVGPNGEVYVIWDDYDNQPAFSQVKMATSLDGGVTYQADRLVGTTPVTRGNGNGFSPTSGVRYHIAAQPDRGILTVPSIVADRSTSPFRGRIYAAYTIRGGGASTNDTDVVVRWSDNHGVNWSTPIRVHSISAASQFLPWIDCDPNSGAVALAYYDTRNSGTNQLAELWTSASVDGGITWSEARLATAPSNQSLSNPSRYGGNYLEYIGVAVRDGTIHAVWADNRDSAGDLEMYTARASFSSATGINQLFITADPVMDNAIVVRPAASNNAYLEVFVNGQREYTGLAASINSMVIDTGAGADVIEITNLHPSIALTINSGPDVDTIILNNSGTAANPASINAGAGDDVLRINPSGTGTSHARIEGTSDFGQIEIGSGGLLRLGGPGAITILTRSLTMSSDATFDLTNSSLIVDYTGASPMSMIRSLLTSGYNAGAWNGAGINSSVAATIAQRALGYAESSDLFSNFPVLFAGHPVDDTAVLIRHTRYGDADLSGNVDLNDFNRFASGFGQTSAGWSNGNFNFDAATNLDDFNLLAGNFGLSAGDDRDDDLFRRR